MTEGKSKRGLACISPERRSEIARKGGRAAHAQGRAHQFTSEEAKRAGKVGGETVASDRAHMQRIGRLGGKANAANKKAAESKDAA